VVDKFTSDRKTKLLAAVTSPFIFILLGSLFKATGFVNVFPILQLVLSFFILVLMSTRTLNMVKQFKFKKIQIVYAILFLGSLYLLSFDAIKFLTISFPDTFASHEWIKIGLRERFSGYTPGFALHLSTSYYLMDPEGSLDFLGAASGFILLLYASIALEILKKYTSIYFLSLFFLPYFVEPQKYLNGFSHNKFFILYIVLIPVLLNELYKETKNQKINLSLLFTVIGSLAYTHLPLFIFLIPVTFIFATLIPFLFKNSLISVFVIVISMLFSGSLYLLNAKNQVKNLIGQYLSLIPVASDSEENFVDFSQDRSIIREEAVQNLFRINYISDPLGSFQNFAGYLALLFAILILISSIKNKIFIKFILSFQGVLFGISTLTGFGQHPYTQGRVGWYFMTIVLVLVSISLQEFFETFKIIQIGLLVSMGIFLSNLGNPPIHYRFDDEYIHFKVFDLVTTINSKMYLYSTIANSNIYSLHNSNVIELTNLSNSSFKCVSSECYPLIVLIDTKKGTPDPILSRSIRRENINDSLSLKRFREEREKVVLSNTSLRNNLKSRGFESYFSDSNYDILIKMDAFY
jgi:hypothetical protein